MSAVIKPPDYERFAITYATEISPLSFLAYYDTLTHFATLRKTTKTDYKMIKEASMLSWEISFQRSTASAKWHLFFIPLQEAVSQLTKLMALMKTIGAVVSEPPAAFMWETKKEKVYVSIRRKFSYTVILKTVLFLISIWWFTRCVEPSMQYFHSVNNDYCVRW